MREAEVRAPLPPLAALDERLRGAHADGVPLLVVRLPELERVAWRRGLRAARALERRAIAAFASAVTRVLRAGDALAHDRGSDLFVAALVAPTRDGEPVAPVDARAGLLRIAAAMEAATALEVVTGWASYAPRGDAESLDAAAMRALQRGAQERERYAFFSALGHELRTPLSSIRGYLETLLDDDVDASTRRRFVRIAHGEAKRLGRLIEGMFEISLLDLHASLPARAHASIAVAVNAARDACAAAAAARGVEIIASRCEDALVAMDGDRLSLVLINLVDNAVKHGRRGGRVCLTTDLSDRRSALISVDDDGPGIPAADRERIFTLGERGATDANGSGIGLALVRLMMERVGGSVETSASALGGARFVVALPRRQSADR